MTVREVARLMTFPDDWRRAGATRGARLAGGAVVGHRSSRRSGHRSQRRHPRAARIVVSRYRSDRPDQGLYRPPMGLSFAEWAAEQDAAAGGRAARLLAHDHDAVVLGTVALRCHPKSRCVHDYLRWSSRIGTTERYIGDLSDCPDRTSRVACRVDRRARPASSTTARRQPVERPA